MAEDLNVRDGVVTDGTSAGDVGTRPPALLLRGVSKTFPGVQALIDVDIEVRPGSVHALLGHNGCGKSTLVKTLAGVHHPDGPPTEALVDGEPLHLGSGDDADRLGIRFVHQELGLILELGAVDNVAFVLGHNRGRLGAINWREQARFVRELLSRFGIALDPTAPLAEATPVERTAVAIVRAVAGQQRGRGLLVLDEPTAALPAREVEELFRLIREIRDSGTSVLMISHRLDEVMAICDHATVMRAGQVIFDGGTHDKSVRDFATMIAGTETLAPGGTEAAGRPPADVRLGDAPATLEVVGLSGRYLREVDLTVRRGEIVGVAGLLGSGREELPYIVAGAQTEGVSGTLKIEGEVMTDLTIDRARQYGVCLVPADRAREGIVKDFTVQENVTIAALPELCRGTTLVPSRDRAWATKWLKAVQADPAVSGRLISTLSGGNQQKAVIARWLSVSPKLLTLSEPTAGIDIGARTTIYEEIRRRADDGLGVLMSSSDAEDLIAVCDRVIVLRDGLIARALDGPEITKQAIVAAMEGVHGEQSD
jgi:ribose transport system ATP-binding protein